MEVYGVYHANVALVRDALRESKTQMTRVDQSLGMFQTGLLGVEREMLPIYTLTEKLRATQRNIDLCVHELRKINDNFVAAQELSPTLLNGAKCEQDTYVQAMQKLLSAITFLESHRSYDGSAKALEQAKELLAQARRKCKSDFVSAVGVLSRGARRAVVAADDSEGDSASSDKTEKSSKTTATLEWPIPSSKELAKVTQLLQCLLSASVDQTELLSEYSKQRFDVVRMALCDTSDDSAATGASSSSATTASLAAATSSIGFYAASTSIAALANKLRDVEASVATEKRLAESIFPTEELAHAAFRYAAYPLLDALRADVDAALQPPATTGSAFSPLSSLAPALPSSPSATGASSDSSSNMSASTNKASSCALDPFKLLLLHELLVTRVRENLDVLVAPPLLLRDRKGRNRDDPWVLAKLLAGVVTQLATAAKQRIFGFQLELTERISINDRSLAKDGNVHPVSSHMLSFLRQVCEHARPLTMLLVRHESNTTPTSFIETAVMQLAEMLQAKTAQSKARSDLKQLFLANNFGFLARALSQCCVSAAPAVSGVHSNRTATVADHTNDDDDDISTYVDREIRPRLERLRDTAIAQFVAISYASFHTFLVDPTEKLVYAKGGDLLTLESGRLLKEKFARFNTQLDDLYKTQKLYIVSEPLVRHELIHAAVDAIVPPYTKFYDKYASVHFSKKNSTKYLKYTPRAAEQALKELFLGEVVAATSERK